MAGTRAQHGETNRSGQSPAHGTIDVTVDRAAGRPVVMRVAGEVDMLTAPMLAEQVRAQFADAGPAVVLDLTDVAFLGSAGLAVLAEAATLAGVQGTVLRVVATSHAVLRPLQVAGLHSVLVIVGDLATALDQCA